MKESLLSIAGLKKQFFAN